MPIRRSACAVAVALTLGAGAVGAGVASYAKDGDKPEWQKRGNSSEPTKTPDRISPDPLGDADPGADIQSLAVFNRKKLDYVGLSITGRDFRIPTTRTVHVYFGTSTKEDKPDFKVVARNRKYEEGASGVNVYRVNGWNGNQKKVGCDDIQVQFAITSQSQIRLAIPRSCLGDVKNLDGVNVSVEGANPAPSSERARGSDTDMAPDEKTLTAPIEID